MINTTLGYCEILWKLYLYSIKRTNKKNMKTETKRNKVEANLLKWGNNPKDVAEMMAHFDLANENHPKASPGKLTDVVVCYYADFVQVSPW